MPIDKVIAMPVSSLHRATRGALQESEMAKQAKAATQYARTLGSIAFANGDPCAPAYNADMRKLISDGREIGDPRTIPELKAFIAGWTSANLAASVQA